MTETRLERAIARLAEAAPDDTSGVASLDVPLDAFAARVALIRAAERSLDIQYYIWCGDTAGLMLLDEVRQAADRGVRVRMLLDDNGIPGLDDELAVLDTHALIEVRIFNPFPSRRFKALGWLHDFRRLNHRMHNKSITADDIATIVGGRNIGNAYFGGDPALAFADLDVLAAGAVSRDVAVAFDAYWRSAPSRRASTTIRRASPADRFEMHKKLAGLVDSALGRTLLAASTRTTVVDDVLEGRPVLEWAPTRLVCDPPAKIDVGGDAVASHSLVAQLARTLGPAQRELDIVSSYFVPGETGAQSLAHLARSGVRVRVVTNSLATSDVTAVHAGYARRRHVLLAGGVRLYELKPDAGVAPAPGKKSWLPSLGSSRSSLHGKTFALDRERIFVGSFNVDPRSLRLNTEMGLVIESESMAENLSRSLDGHLDEVSYRLRLDSHQRLEWIDHTASGKEIIYRTEPKAGLLRRVAVHVLSWLPIEWLL